MAQRAEQRQVRGLALSQQMRLSLDLLRMDGGRLRRRLRLEAARNPCLELVEAPEVIGPRQALLAHLGLEAVDGAEQSRSTIALERRQNFERKASLIALIL